MAANEPSPVPSPEDSYQRLRTEYERLQLLYSLAQQFATMLSLPNVLQHVLSATTRFTNAVRGSIFLYGEHDEVQMHLLSERFQQARLTPFTNRILREGLASWVLKHRQSALIADTNLDERWIDYPSDTLDVRSVLCVPLLRGRRVRGVLTLVHPDIDFFTMDDEALLNVIAQHAAMAIENAQLIADINDERRKFEGAFTAMEEGLILVDGDGRIHFVNPQALAFFAVTPPVPEHLKELSQPVLALFKEAQQTGDSVRAEIVLEQNPTTDLAIHIAYIPIFSEQEDWWTIVLHDITRLKEYDRLKTQFVANASHELRTPLANIKLYARLAQQVKAKTKLPQYLETIASEAGRLEAIVEDLLTLTRLDSGLMHSNPEWVDIIELLRNLAQTYRPLAEAREQRLIFQECTSNLPALWLAPDQFMRVVVNLLSNALKFTPDGGTVTLSVDRQLNAGRAGTIITVADTGPGIAVEHQQRLFERFYRGSNPTESGSGLGLAIVRELLALMGGTISVASTVGQGSQFTCWLPLEQHSHTA